MAERAVGRLEVHFGAALTRVQCLPRVEPSPFFRKICFFK